MAGRDYLPSTLWVFKECPGGRHASFEHVDERTISHLGACDIEVIPVMGNGEEYEQGGVQFVE